MFSQSFVRGTPVCTQAPCSRRIRQRAQRVNATVATEPRTELKTTQSEKVWTWTSGQMLKDAATVA